MSTNLIGINSGYRKNQNVWKTTPVVQKISAFVEIAVTYPAIGYNELKGEKSCSTLTNKIVEYFGLQEKDNRKVHRFIINHAQNIAQEVEKYRLHKLNEARASVINYGPLYKIKCIDAPTCSRETQIPVISNELPLNNEINVEGNSSKPFRPESEVMSLEGCDDSDPDDPQPRVVTNPDIFDSGCKEQRSSEIIGGSGVSSKITVHFDTVLTEKLTKFGKRNFSCRNYMASFCIKKSIWSTIVNDNGKLITETYPKVISDCFFFISKGCVLQMRSVNYPSSKSKKFASIYCYCGHNNVTTFRLDCCPDNESDSVKIHVYTNTNECVHLCKKTRELSGVARDIMKQELLKTSATLVRLDCVQKCDTEGVKLNNLQNVKSYGVVRKARSEVLAADDLHEDCLTDLFMMRDLQRDPKNRYIQHVSHPFDVIVYSEEVMNIAGIAKNKAKSNKKDFVLHLDATGKVVRPIEQCNDKRVFYYCIVFQIGSNIIPLSEYITSKHNSLSIGGWLIKLKDFIISEKKWPLCNRFVTDFSWAIIDAIILQWNKMDLVTYLIYCHGVVDGKLSLSNDKATVHICCCHFVKMCINNIHCATFSMLTKDRKTLKQIIVQVVCCIINSTSYMKVKLLLKFMFTVLLTEEYNADVRYALDRLRFECTLDPNDFGVDISDEYDTEQESIAAKTDDISSLYRKSPFFRDICDMNCSLFIKHGIVRSLDDNFEPVETFPSSFHSSCADNTYYCPALAIVLAKRYIAYLPMWSGILLKGDNHGNVLNRMSNAPVENWFGQVKNVILEGQSKQVCKKGKENCCGSL